jgi:hypothetical protein
MQYGGQIAWRPIAKGASEGHSGPVLPTRAIKMSDELAALLRRAELASARARDLLEENDLWRRRVLAQLDYMFELGTEFRGTGRTHRPVDTLSR